MQPTPTLTHYQRIGGEAKVRELVQRFYQLMDELPEVQRIRKMHHISLKNSEDKLFMLKFGHPRLRQRHMPFAIGDAERDQWMRCMTQALQDVVEDEALRKELTDAFYKVADFMRNQAAQ